VLVVEDEENVRFVTVAALRQGAFEVHETDSGREALRIVADPALAPDLVVLDVMLPTSTASRCAGACAPTAATCPWCS
jgi:CheY-like chemotaxis protein